MSSDSRENGGAPELSQQIADLERELQRVRQENSTLRESEAYWRSLVQAAPVYLSVVDREGRLLFLNRPGTGYRPDEILGRSILEASVPEHRELIRQTLQRVFETGSTENFEACDANQRRWYSTMAGPLYREGEIVAAVQCSEDITEKQEIRRQLAEAESRWRTLLENAPDMIVLFNAEGCVRFINRTSAAYTSDEVVGHRGAEFLSAQDQKPLERAIREVFATGEAQDIEIRETRAGSIYLARIALLGSFAGEPTAIALLRDVTKERQRQQELLDSETRLRLAVNQAPLVLWTTDAELRFTSSMGAGLAFLGNQPNDHNGKNLFEYFGTDDPSYPAINAHLQALKGASVEYTLPWQKIVFQSHVEPLRNPAGEIIGVVGIAMDVTARHVTEVRLRQTGSDLEARVQERTAELDALNRQLLIDIEHRRVVEQELRESEERFRIIAEGLPVAVAIVQQSDHQVLYVNQQACDLFGATVAQLYAGQLQLPWHDEALRQQCLAAFNQGQGVADCETQTKKEDGTSIWISLSVVDIQYQGVEAYICGMLDATRRKEAEEELLEERQLLTRLLDMNERDRQLIAYEIHDGFVQDVTAAVMFLESAEVSLGAAAGPAAHQVSQTLELLRESVGEARRLINGLRPPVLEEAGVEAAVEEVIAKIQEQFGLEIELQSSLHSTRMAPALEMAVYRIIQEGLTNIHRHSQSKRAAVSITQLHGRLRLGIRDWGIGFDPGKTPKKRYGLTGMMERAKLLGGETIIDSRPGAGTNICVDLPMVAVNQFK